MTLFRAAAAQHVLANTAVRRIVSSHLCTVVCEWAAVVGILVHAFHRGGSRATGLTSLVILTASLIGAPLAAVLTDRFRPYQVRRGGLAVQVAGFVGAGVAVIGEAPLAVAVGLVVVALGAVTVLRPTDAALLPASVRSPVELTSANLVVSYCDSASSLLGPLVAAALMALGGSGAVLVACSALSVAALTFSIRGGASGPMASNQHPGVGYRRPARVLIEASTSLRARPRNVGVLAVIGARNVVIGALDVLLVIIAIDYLDLDGSGAGLLSALFGMGAMVASLVTARFARRSHLTPVLALELLIAALALLLLGSTSTIPVAVVTLPIVGACASQMDGLGRILLQRSADPRALGAVFALVELVSGFGLLMGAGAAQLLLALGDTRTALFGIGGMLLLLLALTTRALWLVDGAADVPVVAMTLLQSIPMFAPLTPLALESVARSAIEVEATPGEVVVHQGDPGDRFYAVVDGMFDVTMTGSFVRTVERGGSFGEVALLADVARTATVTSRGPGRLLAIERVPFLVAVTGSDTSYAAAWGVVRTMEFDTALVFEEQPDPSIRLRSK